MLVFNINWVSDATITKNGTYTNTGVQFYATKSIATNIITTAIFKAQATFPDLKKAYDSTTDEITVEIGLHQSEGSLFDPPITSPSEVRESCGLFISA